MKSINRVYLEEDGAISINGMVAIVPNDETLPREVVKEIFGAIAARLPRDKVGVSPHNQSRMACRVGSESEAISRLVCQ